MTKLLQSLGHLCAISICYVIGSLMISQTSLSQYLAEDAYGAILNKLTISLMLWIPLFLFLRFLWSEQCWSYSPITPVVGTACGFVSCLLCFIVFGGGIFLFLFVYPYALCRSIGLVLFVPALISAIYVSLFAWGYLDWWLQDMIHEVDNYIGNKKGWKYRNWAGREW